jgi:ABC-type branched-subunit amino acid transport system substrate-binding protein
VAADDATRLSGAKSTIDAFKAKFTGSSDYGAYTIPAYSATKIMIAAIKKAIEANGGNKPSRAKVLDALAHLTGVDTPLGTISFDQNGDTTQQIISVYKVDTSGPTDNLTCSTTNKSNCWVFVDQKTFS